MKYIVPVLMILLTMTVVAAECSDSDGGKNKYEFGGVTANGETFQDECDDQNIIEYFCSMDQVASYTLLPCVNGCTSGACQVANEAPRAQAPETEDGSNTKLYLYGIVVLIIVGLYVYWFKLKKRR